LESGDYVIWHFGNFDWQPGGSEINLNANILPGPGGGNDFQSDLISFSVNVSGGGNSFNFGDVAPGGVKSQIVSITNQGQVGLYIESAVTGDEVFRNYLDIDNVSWRNFNANLQGGGNKSAEVKL